MLTGSIWPRCSKSVPAGRCETGKQAHATQAAWICNARTREQRALWRMHISGNLISGSVPQRPPQLRSRSCCAFPRSLQRGAARDSAQRPVPMFWSVLQAHCTAALMDPLSGNMQNSVQGGHRALKRPRSNLSHRRDVVRKNRSADGGADGTIWPTRLMWCVWMELQAACLGA